MFSSTFANLINLTLLWKWYLKGKTEILVQNKNKIALVLIQHVEASGYFIHKKLCAQNNIFKCYIFFLIKFFIQLPIFNPFSLQLPQLKQKYKQCHGTRLPMPL